MVSTFICVEGWSINRLPTIFSSRLQFLLPFQHHESTIPQAEHDPPEHANAQVKAMSQRQHETRYHSTVSHISSPKRCAYNGIKQYFGVHTNFLEPNTQEPYERINCPHNDGIHTNCCVKASYFGITRNGSATGRDDESENDVDKE